MRHSPERRAVVMGVVLSGRSVADRQRFGTTTRSPLALTGAGASGLNAAELAGLTWANFFVQNLLPVTIGNVIGGAILVKAGYWFVSLRPGVDRTSGEAR